MKKSISLSIVVVLGAIISVYSMNTTKSLENSLLLENIEALTDSSEGGSGGNWLKGYAMNSMHVYVSTSVGGTVTVSTSQPSYGFGITVLFKQIYCCEKANQGTDCNKDGNYPECGHLPLYY